MLDQMNIPAWNLCYLAICETRLKAVSTRILVFLGSRPDFDFCFDCFLGGHHPCVCIGHPNCLIHVWSGSLLKRTNKMRRDVHLDGSANKLHHRTRLGTAIICMTFASINTVDEYLNTFIFKSRPLQSESVYNSLCDEHWGFWRDVRGYERC